MIQLKDYRVEKKQMPSELTLRQWIRESPVKSQENPLEKQIAIFFLVKQGSTLSYLLVVWNDFMNLDLVMLFMWTTQYLFQGLSTFFCFYLFIY